MWCIICIVKVEVNQTPAIMTTNWSYLHLLELAIFARMKTIVLLTVRAKIMEMVEMEVINAMEIQDAAIRCSWALITTVLSGAT
jgi:hypothetical protein